MSDSCNVNRDRKTSCIVLQPTGTSPYTVLKCDTLAGVAAQFDTTTSVLKKINRLMSDLVFPGQVLFVPDADYTLINTVQKSPSSIELGGNVKMSKMLGHVERLSSVEADEIVMLPRPLSTEEVKKLLEQCDERFIKLNVQRIIRTEAHPVHGVMLVTPDCVMFDPEPLAVETGVDRYSVVLQMNSVMSVAVYHDLTLQQVQHASRQSDDYTSSSFNFAEDSRDNNAESTKLQQNCIPKSLVGSQLCTDSLPEFIVPQDGLPEEKCCIVLSDEETEINASAADACATVTASNTRAIDEYVAVTDSSTRIADECGTVCDSDTTTTDECGTVIHSRTRATDKCGRVPDSAPTDPTTYKTGTSQMRIYLCIKGVSAGAPSLTEKITKSDTFWFSVPYEKVDQLFAFFLQWSPNLCDDKQFANDKGFIVVSDLDDTVLSIDDLSPRQSKLCHSSSFSKDWEIVNVLQLQQRVTEAEIDNLPLPTLSHPSDILEESHLRVFMNHLLARAEGGSWQLSYSANKHGFSLRTLYRHMAAVDSPVLLIIKDCSGQVFGTMQSSSIKPSDLFYGTGESYLFTFNPDFKKFRWTGINSFFTKGSQESVCFGASKGNNGLWLDGDLYHGRTQHCLTYNNDLLSSSEDFTIECLEAWCFV